MVCMFDVIIVYYMQIMVGYTCRMCNLIRELLSLFSFLFLCHAQFRPNPRVASEFGKVPFEYSPGFVVEISCELRKIVSETFSDRYQDPMRPSAENMFATPDVTI